MNILTTSVFRRNLCDVRERPGGAYLTGVLGRGLHDRDVSQASAAMCSRATAAIWGDSSIPTTAPCGPTFSRSRPLHSPVPHPTPRTTCPRRTGTASMTASR
jgi:hypothetical protein